MDEEFAMGIQVDQTLSVVCLRENAHIINKPSLVLNFGQELPVDAVGMDATVFGGVEDEGVEWTSTNPGEDHWELGLDFTINLFYLIDKCTRVEVEQLDGVVFAGSDEQIG